ncbi:GntR family transcriptional regulator [Nocardia huaxiensis]|uniref:GntR family transcriptional regulator n=1 Tax=Nocardia huaxiensis TaxID=2755382 RepID=A0A7D6VB43_9NOCA|nr:GntR family transcriptional regulator [Nocardia huaxiensis]QLY32172.1 GntR family transcriptional regulator [Nocardia huaxiensis]UFS94128.1 GntR family transcriptional regulator [Nocardia huaxiensis]
MARRGRIPLSERVYRSLRGDLAAGVLVPTERLGEERLAETYGVSRTPVREALARLLADGLVERHPDGFYPYRPRVEELADLYELRILLEARGIQRRHAHDPEPVRRELATWRDLRDHPPEPGAALIAADERFHTALLAASGNAALADALDTVHARVRPLRALDLPTTDRVASMTDEHIAIAEHLLAGDPDKALDALVAHITTSRDHVLARAEHALRLTRMARALRD